MPSKIVNTANKIKEIIQTQNNIYGVRWRRNKMTQKNLKQTISKKTRYKTKLPMFYQHISSLIQVQTHNKNELKYHKSVF